MRTYIAIDLKSFYASVECVERGLNPLTTNLVVADKKRTEKTICLAVSPSLKAFGISGRARLFEVMQRMREVNFGRKERGEKPLTYIIAPPRMAKYLEYSHNIFNIYQRYVAPDDIHVYSCDEVFMDVTQYLELYKKTAHELAMEIIQDVLRQTNITATAGIGTNLYLCKVAMDIVAKHAPADQNGVRIAELDEREYRELLWDHRPLTDFWRVGRGIANKLMAYGIDTMGKIARQSVKNEELFYQLFGVNAELLIDHAWGWEPCTMEYIKSYRPETSSMSNGQVLQRPYSAKEARSVVTEMAEKIALDLVTNCLITNQIDLTISYDKESIENPNIKKTYQGEIKVDFYGRQVPKHSHGTERLDKHTSSTKLITDATLKIYDKAVNPDLLIRRLTICAGNVISEFNAQKQNSQKCVQLDIFTDYNELARKKEEKQKKLNKEHRLQKTLLDIKAQFGKNAIMKGTSYNPESTAKQRNRQIGGHNA